MAENFNSKINALRLELAELEAVAKKSINGNRIPTPIRMQEFRAIFRFNHDISSDISSRKQTMADMIDQLNDKTELAVLRHAIFNAIIIDGNTLIASVVIRLENEYSLPFWAESFEYLATNHPMHSHSEYGLNFKGCSGGTKEFTDISLHPACPKIIENNLYPIDESRQREAYGIELQRKARGVVGNHCIQMEMRSSSVCDKKYTHKLSADDLVLTPYAEEENVAECLDKPLP